MARHFASVGFVNLCLAFVALELSTLLDPQCAAGTATSAGAPLMLHSAAEILPPFAAVVVLFVAVALIYHHHHHHHLMGRRVVDVPVAGAGNHAPRSISGLVIFALYVSAGTLEFIVFGQAGGGTGTAEDHGAQARAVGLAALRALPAAATATFFLGMMLIIVAFAHVRAGGGDAVAGDGPVHGPLRLLTKVAAGAAAALVGLMVMALTVQLHGAKLRLGS